MVLLDHRVVSRLRVEDQDKKGMYAVYFVYGGRRLKVGRLNRKNLDGTYGRSFYNLSSRELTNLIGRLPSFDSLVSKITRGDYQDDDGE